ncbi:MAG: NADH:ubiquinone reductase (Na(+)-transporting) subunit B [Bacteroidales bacterium]|nr:NADH:ubiquinone reductase (Na(+)-transporting) subunit B [Bacteroidales bacterium]
MMGLRQLFDNMKPTFSKGGKLSALGSFFDAMVDFVYVPKTVTRRGAHVRDSIDLKRTMIMVMIALVPAILCGMYNIGYRTSITYGLDWGFWMILWKGFLKILPLYLVSYIVGLFFECLFAQIRDEEVNEGYFVTGLLIPLIVPVTTPLWMLALAVAFAVVIGKEVFGGTGMNIWNPALVARAFLFFAYPKQMSGDMVWVAHPAGVDAVAGATPLSVASAGGMQGLQDAGYSVFNMFIGNIPGAIGETSKFAILLGAILLIWTGVGSWKVMVSAVAGALLVGLLGDVPCYYQLLMGGFAFGAVFMATDPVTGCQTETGKWIYGFLIGAFAVLLRLFNPGYPEGMMLAILLMNSFAPLIDHLVVNANIKKRLKRAQTL